METNSNVSKPVNPYRIITVFGAKGKVGIELLQFFSKHGIHCRAVTRDVTNVPALPYVTWIGGDLNNTASIFNLVAGSNAIFLNTDFAPNMVDMHSQVIEAAKLAGVKHIVRLSYGLLPEEVLQKANSPVHQLHIQADEALVRSGLPYTILRPSGFMQSWLYELPSIKSERKIHEAPGDGRLPYIDTRDIAEVIAAVLLNEKHYNQVYELTGNEAINFHQVADAISQAIGETVTYIPETTPETTERLRGKRYPEWAVQLLLFFAQSQQEGKLNYTTNTVKDILGKPGHDVYAFARDYAERFR